MKKINGLTDKEVNEARKKYGTNTISQTKKNSFLKLFLESLGDPIIKILIIALVVKIVFLFRDFDIFETLGILISILAASLVSTISEYGSEAAFKKLEEESSKINVKVIRNGIAKLIPIDEVVVGDMVRLNSGDKIPSDGIIVKGTIEVDESSINGEPINKRKEVNEELYRGTIVYNGEAIMQTKSVGIKTMYGSIASELQEKTEPSPLKLKLAKLAKTISKLGYIGAVLVSLSYLFSRIVIANNFNAQLVLNDITNAKVIFSYLLHALTLAVTVIIVSVPEGLPLMVTLVLSSNMRRMLKKNVLVRKLVGIETAGSLNYLLTDKTGTLTKGILEVNSIITLNKKYQKFSTIENKKYQDLIYKSIYYNNSSNYDINGNVIGGNSTDSCLLRFISEDLSYNCKILKYLPFDNSKKYSLVTIEDKNKETYIKGAPEYLIKQCTKYYNEQGEKKYLINKEKITSELKEYTSKGFRVIALVSSDNYHLTNEINNLTFIGLVVIKDELRSESKTSIETIKKAGIKTIMITGDDLTTAKQIATEVGIIENNNDMCLTSTEFNKMTDEEIVKYHDHIKIIARALPKDKSRLVHILQTQKYVVGMTGDGVNDAPALKKADVGISLGSGTEVAKEASDIVILDDNISSICEAILFGRTIFKNIRKFIIFQLSLNICAVAISVICPFIGIDTPITIVQMLWINMIMDTLAGIAFSYEPPNLEYMDEPPLKKDTAIINKYMTTEIIVSGLYQAIICILFLKLPLFHNLIRNNNKYLMTAYFSLFVFMGVFNSFNARTERLNIVANLRRNTAFIIIITFIIITQIYITYYGGNIFRTYGLNFKELFLVLIISLTIIPIDWIRKIYLKNKN